MDLEKSGTVEKQRIHCALRDDVKIGLRKIQSHGKRVSTKGSALVYVELHRPPVLLILQKNLKTEILSYDGLSGVKMSGVLP